MWQGDGGSLLSPVVRAPLPLVLGVVALAGVLCTTLSAVPPDDGDGPFFVYTGSFREKPAAQRHARTHGGWVLRTDLYRGLTPGFFAVVHGPFDRRADAEAALRGVREAQPEAFVRAAGASTLPAALGDPALLAALLGELTATVRDEPDPALPCRPAERHTTVYLGAAPEQAGIAADRRVLGDRADGRGAARSSVPVAAIQYGCGSRGSARGWTPPSFASSSAFSLSASSAVTAWASGRICFP